MNDQHQKDQYHLLFDRFDKMTFEKHSDVNIPINSGVPLSAVIRTPGRSSSAKPKSISLISQLSLLTQTMFSGLGQKKNKTKERL